MSSACINPVLYGYLNETFRTEFTEIVKFCCSCFLRKQSEDSALQNGEELQPLEIKVVGEDKNYTLKVENRLIPRDRDDQVSNADLVTVHPNNSE